MFAAASIGLIFLIFIMFDKDVFSEDVENIIPWFLFLLVTISGIYYTVKTKFWTTRPTVFESLERETEIIKKQIEKKELLAKLENLENNEQVS